MLMMMATKAQWQSFGSLRPEEIQAHIAFMKRLDQELRQSGELVDDAGLAGPDRARIVRAGKGGVPLVTDGPFPETKEFLAGFWIVDCETPQRAVEIAARASTAPGARGVPMNIPIEVREVMSAPGDESGGEG
jgi:hypothetical protein